MSVDRWVVDCSAAMTIVLGEDAADEIDGILQAAIEAHAEIVVPSLFWFEVTNTLVMAERRGRLEREDLRLAESDIAALPIVAEPPPDPFVRERIRELAQTYELTAYDAAYLECAQRLDRRLKTVDQDLLDLGDRFDFIS